MRPDQSALPKDFKNLWTENNRGAATETIVMAEYLEVRATKAQYERYDIVLGWSLSRGLDQYSSSVR
jgi:hypothetical protein